MHFRCECSLDVMMWQPCEHYDSLDIYCFSAGYKDPHHNVI